VELAKVNPVQSWNKKKNIFLNPTNQDEEQREEEDEQEEDDEF
jgi:hypothetical protein